MEVGALYPVLKLHDLLDLRQHSLVDRCHAQEDLLADRSFLFRGERFRAVR